LNFGLDHTNTTHTLHEAHINFTDLLRAAASHKKNLCNIKYRAYQSPQLLFETFISMMNI